MITKDYYCILKIERSASASEIKNAYRKLALECHPDHHQEDLDAEEKIKEINEAYSVLGDELKKKEYDLMGTVSSATSDIYSNFRQGMGGGRRRFNMGGGGCCGRSSLFSEKMFINVIPGQFYEFIITPQEARFGTERLVMIVSGKRRSGYHIKIPGGVTNGTQIKAVLGRDESRFILVRISVSDSAYGSCI
ncbi:MAG TPA: hypothetical protein DCY00_08525 [Actinobacteria bacterium]|nr:hypothetical protein [Actinomycetota bacterium]